MPPFNSYQVGLNLDPIKDYCVRHGELMKYSRGDSFEDVGMPASKIGLIKKGSFKYLVRNETEGKDYITGFAFEGEFVGDFPNCIDNQPATVSIISLSASEVYVIDRTDLSSLIEQHSFELIYKHLFSQVYSLYLDSFRMTVRERYLHLLHRCPQIVQQINLKDLASFLRVTPTTISRIRREITFVR